ncbi:MAG: hypothetical protein LBP83_05020, partial [Dysgonamonadaceae bacterium]|nr:hypothetical protein [Dysgonamonadaceae bacterium]
MATNIDIQGIPISRLPREASTAGIDVSGAKSGRTVKVSLDLLATKTELQNIENNRKGYFSTEAELNAAYPTPKVGWYAYVGSSGTIWKESSGIWVNSGEPIPDDVDLSLYARQSDLEAEAAARSSADSTLGAAIGNETIARSSADTGIRNAADIYNVTQKVPLQSGYYTPATARAAVPAAIRKKGLIITYQTGASSWRTEQFFQGELAAW